MNRLILSLLLLCGWGGMALAKSLPHFVMSAGEPVVVAVDSDEEKVVHIAVELLKRDVEAVLAADLKTDGKQGDILVATFGKSDLLDDMKTEVAVLEGKHEAFLLKVLPDGRLLVAGSDKRGTAYGVLELSRMLGVSPWEWWADATPVKRETFYLPAGYRNEQAPTVPYRGIFLNDEDWGLLPWSNQTYEPHKDKNHIGPRTYSRIFELMLRLRANTMWPAMHECTLPFFLTEGNRQAAADYGIFIGSSHCEPMVCNAAGEWSRRGEGAYDYVNNSKKVYDFWEKRVKEVAGQDNIYTLGMRGVHDGKMQGAKTVAEQKAVLDRVLEDQRGLIAKYVNEDVTSVPQVFIPYKEVLDIYHAGLEVPDEVTLMWCDDNYGYIRHFPTAEERARKGGNGIYYHASYWGRPHDYLWLNTMHPALIFQQMSEAYSHGIQQMWILNVGDLKPGEYQTELFMDMAWNFDEVTRMGVKEHYRNFLNREFGKQVADELQPVMEEYYRRNFIHRPEFMGSTRTEEKAPAWKVVKDLPLSEKEVRAWIDVWKRLSDKVEATWKLIPEAKQDAYYHLVKYQVQGSAQMNMKMLNAQLARHGKGGWEQSDAAYDSIVALTQRYNEGFHNNGKWNKMMTHRPRKLAVFDRVKRDTVEASLQETPCPQVVWNGVEYAAGNPVACEWLGYEGGAVAIKQGESISYETGQLQGDTAKVCLTFLPNHPIEGNALRVAVSLDGSAPKIVSYETKGRSEEWKENVLWNRATRQVVLPLGKSHVHRVTLTPLDKGVVLDQVKLY